MQVNDPEVVRQVTAVFDRYERALLANDLETLGELFWHSPLVQRVGFADRQHGFAEVDAARRAVARQSAPRRLVEPVVATFGTDVAVVTTEFDTEPEGADGGGGRRGRQSQTWVRIDGGWRVVAAHVSWPSPA